MMSENDDWLSEYDKHQKRQYCPISIHNIQTGFIDMPTISREGFAKLTKLGRRNP